MHAGDATDADRDSLPVRSFRPVTLFDDAGEVTGLLLWYPSLEDGERWLECEVEALRAGLATAPSAPIVGFFPEGLPDLEVSRFVSAAADALANQTVVAPLLPVTDAVKVVDGQRIVGTRDRSRLRLVQGPAFARRDAVLRVLQASQSDTIRPLVEVARGPVQIGSLEATA